MFIGEYKHTIDVKKRLAIPVRFRKELGDKAVLTRGLDGCLFLFPQKEWEQWVLSQGGSLKPAAPAPAATAAPSAPAPAAPAKS